SSGKSFRGPGMQQGLAILAEVRKQVGVPVLTDVHSIDEVEAAAAAVDVLQTPAFLCRQTDFIRAVASAGRPVNIKKGQFLSPQEMKNVVEKAREASGRDNVLVCERGYSFGYGNLVSDMRSLAIMRNTGCPVVFDATHSVQLPGGLGQASGGQREFIPVLARAAVASGISGLFMETHPQPERALSDGPNAWPLHLVEPLLEEVQRPGIRPVRQRALRLWMRLHEEARDAARDRRPCEHRNELALPAGSLPETAGKLHRMRRVEHHRAAGVAHDRE